MKKILLFAFTTLAITIVSQNSNAQCGPVGNGTNGTMGCMYSDSISHCLYMGGGFNNSGTDTMHHCCYWNDSTYCSMSMMGHNGTNDSVWCFVRLNTDLYVGGNFTQAGGVSANHIARWDGTNWYAVGSGFNSSVRSLSVYNNELYAGGDFTASGSNAINYLGKWNGTNWVQVSTGTNGSVRAMAVMNNALFIGGDFTIAGGVTVNHITKWDGTNFFAVANGFSNTMMGGSCSVFSLAVYNGQLYCGGVFNHSGTTSMQHLAMWNGSNWSSFGDVGSGMMSDMVCCMSVYDSSLYIGGNFSTCNSSTSNNLACWNGSTWSTIGTGMNGTVRTMAVFNSKLYIGGSFTSASGTSVSNIASYSRSTAVQQINVKNISLSIYPNPVTDFVQFSWSNANASAITLIISDMLGRNIFQQNLGTIDAGIHKQNLPVNELSEGIYFLTLNSGDNKYTSKFEVKK